MNRKLLALVGACSAAVASEAVALTWSSANVADSKTILLYHFDEGTGTTAASAVAGRSSFSLTGSNLWSTDSNWLAGGSGASLYGTNAPVTNGKSWIGRTASEESTNWGASGVTISFWMKDGPGSRDADNYPVILGHDGWRDMQAQLGYRSQWGDTYLRTAGVNATTRRPVQGGAYPFLSKFVDGQWHHVGLVFDNATDRGMIYVDNVLQQLGTDAGGNPLYHWNITTPLSGIVSEFVYIGSNTNGYIDELLVQGEVMSDFSNGLNATPAPEPASLSLIGLGGVALLKRRRRA